LRLRILLSAALLCAAALAAAAFVSTRSGAAQAHGANLIVRSDVLGSQWLVRDEQLSANACSVEEGNVDAGLRRLVRFTVMTPNIGDEDIYVGDPNEHVAAGDGLFELATCHHHYHFRHYALYQLIDPRTGKIWKAAKKGFCMLDTDPNPASLGYGSPGPGKYHNCGAVGIPGNQGVTACWADTYRFYLAGQFFVLDGGDGQDPVPPGDYIIRVTVNPPFVAKKGEACPYKDTNGFCHQLPETNYDDNVGQTTVKIPSHPGREGYGPLKGDTTPTVEDRCVE
jgi:Ni/Co efflux regulator RcnB